MIIEKTDEMGRRSSGYAKWETWCLRMTSSDERSKVAMSRQEVPRVCKQEVAILPNATSSGSSHPTKCNLYWKSPSYQMRPLLEVAILPMPPLKMLQSTAFPSPHHHHTITTPSHISIYHCHWHKIESKLIITISSSLTICRPRHAGIGTPNEVYQLDQDWL